MYRAKHNISNALAAIAFAAEAGFDTDTIIRGLQSFGGTARRFEYKGKLGASRSLMIMRIIRQKSLPH
ncbi:MAG: hypothetical protein V8R46_05270 [Eubacterium ramulus]